MRESGSLAGMQRTLDSHLENHLPSSQIRAFARRCLESVAPELFKPFSCALPPADTLQLPNPQPGDTDPGLHESKYPVEPEIGQTPADGSAPAPGPAGVAEAAAGAGSRGVGSKLVKRPG